MKNHKWYRKLIVVLGMGMMIGGLVACESSGTGGRAEPDGLISLRIGYPIAGADFMGGVAGIAQELGFLEEELEQAGYAVSFTGFSGAGPAVNEAMAAGNIDFALYADFPGIVLTSRGVPTALLSVTTSQIHAGLIVAPDSEIGLIEELRGKRIAFPRGTFVQKYLIQALEAYGIGQDEVELINMTTDAESALLSGAVDAIAYIDQFIATMADQGHGRIIHTSRENEQWPGSIILIASQSYIDEHREAGVAFLRALIRAREYARENPDEVYRLFAEKGNLSLEAAEYVHNLDDSRFDYFSLEIDGPALEKLTHSQQFLLDEKMIEEEFDATGWGDPDIYEEAVRSLTP